MAVQLDSCCSLLANKLTISYGAGPIDVPAPSESELIEIEHEITTRAESARRAISKFPTETKPSIENCSYCDVRHLCGTYWEQETMQRLCDQSTSQSTYTDLQVKINSQQAEKCWKGVVLSSPILTPEKPILLRTCVFDNSIDDALSCHPGANLRVLGARLINASADSSPAVLTMSEKSEAYLVR